MAEYQDRGMLKWMPFEALEEYGGYLEALLEEERKETPPEVANDQLEAMQYRIEEAWMKKESLTFLLFDNGRRRRKRGCIVGIDRGMRRLMLDSGWIPFDALIDVEE